MSTLPPLSSLSRRIHRGVDHLCQPHIASRDFTAMLCFPEPPKSIFDREIAVLRAEHLSTDPPPVRILSRPYQLDDLLDHHTPQFTLRNTMRKCEDACPDDLPFQRVDKEAVTSEIPSVAVLESFKRLSLPVSTGHDWIRSYLAERAEVMVEPWQSRFGRPDP